MRLTKMALHTQKIFFHFTLGNCEPLPPKTSEYIFYADIECSAMHTSGFFVYVFLLFNYFHFL